MISRGQIYFVNLGPTHGHEQAGRRPVLVVSADAINRQPLVVTVVVGTRASRIPRDYPTNVRISAQETGLPEDTVFLCFQIRSLDPARFLDPKTGWRHSSGLIFSPITIWKWQWMSCRTALKKKFSPSRFPSLPPSPFYCLSEGGSKFIERLNDGAFSAQGPQHGKLFDGIDAFSNSGRNNPKAHFEIIQNGFPRVL
jgi:mRNA interferase MazF